MRTEPDPKLDPAPTDLLSTFDDELFSIHRPQRTDRDAVVNDDAVQL